MLHLRRQILLPSTSKSHLMLEKKKNKMIFLSFPPPPSKSYQKTPIQWCFCVGGKAQRKGREERRGEVATAATDQQPSKGSRRGEANARAPTHTHPSTPAPGLPEIQSDLKTNKQKSRMIVKDKKCKLACNKHYRIFLWSICSVAFKRNSSACLCALKTPCILCSFWRAGKVLLLCPHLLKTVCARWVNAFFIKGQRNRTNFRKESQPPTVVSKMEAQSEHVVHVACTFLHIWRRTVCSVGAYEQNFCIGAQSEAY